MTRIVAVHGNGGGSTRFDSVAGLFSEEIRFDAIDLPGFNGVPIDPALTTVADYADHLGGLLHGREERGEDLPVVLGHGIGGSIALDLASRHPDRLSGLILHAPVGANLDTRLFPRIMSSTAMRELVRRLIAARPLRPIWRRLFFPSGAPSPVLDTFFEGYRSCQAFAQMFEIIDASWFEALAPATELPVVLLWGEHDRVLRSGQTEGIRAKTPRARVVIQPGWDHFPMIEEPEDYARVVAQLANDLATQRS